MFVCVASLAMSSLLHLIKLASLLAKNGILSFQVLGDFGPTFLPLYCSQFFRSALALH